MGKRQLASDAQESPSKQAKMGVDTEEAKLAAVSTALHQMLLLFAPVLATIKVCCAATSTHRVHYGIVVYGRLD